VGDKILQEVAETLLKTVRSMDIVARYGGRVHGDPAGNQRAGCDRDRGASAQQRVTVQRGPGKQVRVRSPVP